MRRPRRPAVGLLAAYGALGVVAACSDLLGIKDFTAAGADSGTPSATDGSSSSGSIQPGSGGSGGSSSGSTSGSGSGSGSSSTSGSGSASGSSSGEMTDGSSGTGSEAGSGSGSGSSGGADSGSTSGSDSGTMPVIAFTGYATVSNSHGVAAQELSPTLGWPQSAGDLIVLLINIDVPTSISQISDTSGNTYTQFGTPVVNGYVEMLYYCLGAKASAASANAITVSLSAASRPGQFSVAVFGFRVPGYAWIPDQYVNNSQNNVTAVTTGTVTTRYANEVLVAGTGVQSDDTAASGASWIVEPKDGLGDVQEFEIVTSIQANIAATFTQAQSGTAVSQLGTFAVTPRDGG